MQPKGKAEFTEEEIIDRLMLPMIIETVRCLDEGIVESATEADMGLVYGVGFPPFRGGALKYADTHRHEDHPREVRQVRRSSASSTSRPSR